MAKHAKNTKYESALFDDLHDDNFPDPKTKLIDNPHILQELARRKNLHTQDFHKLKLRPYIPVFVYGTLRAGMRLHKYLEDCPTLGDGVSCSTEYNMYQYLGGGYPVILKNGEKDFGAIYGEVYVVPPERILELDDIEGNGVMYNREEKMVWLMDQTVQDGKRLRPAVKCMMYLGRQEYWECVVNMRKISPVDCDFGHIRIKKVYDWLKN